MERCEQLSSQLPWPVCFGVELASVSEPSLNNADKRMPKGRIVDGAIVYDEGKQALA